MALTKEIQILNFLIFFEIHFENRYSTTFSIRQDKVIVRIPKLLPTKLKEKHWQKAILWTEKQLSTKPNIQEHLPIRSYPPTFKIKLYDHWHYFQWHHSDQSHTTSPQSYHHIICLKNETSQYDSFHQISKSISSIAKKYYRNQLQEELLHLLKTYSKKSIRGLRLKYNKTNWGSCSSKQNINLNTRLVLLPKEVRQYIMLHEIAHLHHMNHSAQFWALVESWMPNYNTHIDYLRKHQFVLDFHPQSIPWSFPIE